MLKKLLKVAIIFTVGFISRFLVNYFTGINVFIDFIHYISFIYYSLFSFFILFVHEFDNLSFNKITYGPFNNNLNGPKEIKVKTFLTMESNRDNNLDDKSNNDYGSNKEDNSIYYRIHDNNRKITLSPNSPPRVNHLTKPKFIPYSEGLRQTNSNSNLSPIPSVPNTPNLNNLSTPSMSTVSELTPYNEIITERIDEVTGSNNNTLSNSNISTRTNYNPTNDDLPHIDTKLNGYRRNSDYALFRPRHFSDVDIERRKEQIIKNTRKSVTENIINENSNKKECLPSKLINKLGSKLVELEEKLEEWDKKEQVKYKKEMEN
jgi:hypothetical protein